MNDDSINILNLNYDLTEKKSNNISFEKVNRNRKYFLIDNII